jgi:hypothetical protein
LGADKNWLEFVIENRFDRYADKKYDIIQGPVANDDVYPTILLYESGDLTKDAFSPERSEYDKR